jgi:hypothetical protein
MEHIHPPFWCAGMRTSELQILLHDPCISDYEVRLEGAEGVTLNEVVRFDNPNYLVLYVDVHDACVQTFNIVLQDSEGREVVVPYELRARECEDVRRKTFDSSDVVYLVMPDRFARGFS